MLKSVHHVPEHLSTMSPDRTEGEGWGEGEHMAVVVIPFTLCLLLLCNDVTGERARVAQSPPPWRPGLPAVNRRCAVPSAYSFRLIGDGRRKRPCKARPLGASMRLAPAGRQTPQRFTAGPGHRCESIITLRKSVSLLLKKLTGGPSTPAKQITNSVTSGARGSSGYSDLPPSPG